MASAAIDIALNAKDNASRTVSAALGGIEARASALGNTLRNLSAIWAAVMGGGQALAFAAASINAAREAEDAYTRVAGVILATGGAAGKTADEVVALANSLERATGISAETIEAAQAVSLTFRNIKGDEFDRATEAALDMAVVLGQDASSAAMQLGKALNDPAEGLTKLKKVGVTFSQAQEYQIKKFQEAGDVASAQKVILAELEHEFGGVARAMRETFGGAAKTAALGFGEMQEAAGGLITKSPAVVAALNGLADSFFGFADTIAKNEPVSREFILELLTGLELVGKGILSIRYAWNAITLLIQTSEQIVVSFFDSFLAGQEALLEATNVGGAFDYLIGSTKAARAALADLDQALRVSNAQDFADIEANTEAWKAYGRAIDAIKNKVFTAGPVSPLATPKRAASTYEVDTIDPKKHRLDDHPYLDSWLAKAKEAEDVGARAVDRVYMDSQEHLKELAEKGEAGAVGVKDAWLDQAKAKKEADERAAEASNQAIKDQIDAVRSLGALSAEYRAEEGRRIDETAQKMREGGAEEVAIRQWVKEEREKLDGETWEATYRAADNYYTALEARTQQWVEKNRVTVQYFADATVSAFDTVISAMGQTIAQAIVYQKSMAQMISQMLKSLAAQVIQWLVETALRYVLSSIIQIQAASAEMATKVAGNAAVTYASAYSSSVGSMGLWGAAAYAAGATAIMEAGAALAYSETYGLMRGLAGISHGGLTDVPREGTYLLDQGERVIKRDQNRDLTDFLAGGKAGGGQTVVILELNGRELGRAVADLHNTGRVPVKPRAA